jgi:signal transduction histidine kinase
MTATLVLGDDGGVRGVEDGRAEPALPPWQTTVEGLVAGIAHDLRTPINVLSGAISEMDADPIVWRDPEQRALYVRLMRSSIDRLQRMASHLAMLSELLAGTIVLSRRMIDLRPLVERAATGARPEGPQVSSLVPGEPVEGPVDAERLLQALEALVSTAQKAARSSVALELAAEGDHARIDVVDDGPAMTNGDAEELLESFGGHRGASRCGPALVVARGLIEAHGGSIAAERATPEGGVRLVMRLPGRGR